MLEGLIFFIIVTILFYFKVDISKLPILNLINETGFRDEGKAVLMSIMIITVKAIVSKFKFLKKGLFVEIKQQNKKSNKEETEFQQRELLEKNRTVVIKFNIDVKYSWWNYLLKNFLKDKTVKLVIDIEDSDKEYITLDLNGAEIEGNYSYYDIKSYLMQNLRYGTGGNETFSYIINLNLEDEEEKEKVIYIHLCLLVNDKELNFFYNWLFNFCLFPHKVIFNIEKRSNE